MCVSYSPEGAAYGLAWGRSPIGRTNVCTLPCTLSRVQCTVRREVERVTKQKYLKWIFKQPLSFRLEADVQSTKSWLLHASQIHEYVQRNAGVKRGGAVVAGGHQVPSWQKSNLGLRMVLGSGGGGLVEDDMSQCCRFEANCNGILSWSIFDTSVRNFWIWIK